MPQPRVPTAELEARGSFRAHPERKAKRKNEPRPSGPLCDPPAWLSKAQRQEWAYLASRMPEGVASNWDETAFEVLVCLVVSFRHRQKLGLPVVVGELTAMNRLFTQFGMTPADRSRVSVKKNEAKSEGPWARWTGKPQ